jgi:lipoic acid synthetase
MLALRHVVITSVTRDDLPDGGASHFAATVGAVRDLLPGAAVEVLVPDFQGDWRALRALMAATPEVLNHNVETVPRLYPTVRPGARYKRSAELLRRGAEMVPDALVKSGFMVGLGESRAEVLSLLGDLREAGVRAVTIGQYLQPTRAHLPVAEYVTPAAFEEYEGAAREMGFEHVLSGPLVRSSYHAADLVDQAGCTGQ